MADSIDREYPAEATIGDQWRRGEAGKVGTPSLPPAELHQHILQLAYESYLRRGKVHGYDLDDWLAAERKVLNVMFHSNTPRVGE